MMSAAVTSLPFGLQHGGLCGAVRLLAGGATPHLRRCSLLLPAVPLCRDARGQLPVRQGTAVAGISGQARSGQLPGLRAG